MQEVEHGFHLSMALEIIFRHRGQNPVNLDLLVDMLVDAKTKEAKEGARYAYHTELLGIGKHKSKSWWSDFLLGPVCDAEFFATRLAVPFVFFLTAKAEAFRIQHPFSLQATATSFSGSFLVQKKLHWVDLDS